MPKKYDIVDEEYFDEQEYNGPERPDREFLEKAAGFDPKLLFHPRSKWSVDKKIEVAGLYLQKPNSITVSKLTGVPAPTIREWTRKAIWWNDTLERCKLLLDAEIAGALTRALKKGAENLVDQMENGHYVHVETREWEEEILSPSGETTTSETPRLVTRKRKVYEKQPMSGTQLSTMVGTIYDKLALMNGKPTSRTENVNDKQDIISVLESKLIELHKEKNAGVIEGRLGTEQTSSED